jgi:uncharacterized repeat protein (TIGR01451 family)
MIALALVLGTLAPAVFAQTISNVASASYTDPGGTPFTTTSNAASQTVLQFLNAGKSFTPNSIASGGTSTLTITLNNPNTFAVSGLTFDDVFPVAPGAMTVAAAPAASNSCGGSLTDSGGGALAAGDAGIRLTGGSLAAGASCTVTVAVTASVNGTYVNTIPAAGIDTAQGVTNGADVSGSLIVGIASPTASKTFNPSAVRQDDISTLSIVLNNPGAADLIGVAFTDTFPATPGALVVASPPNASSTCGGTLADDTGGALGAGDAGIRISGATIPAGASCTVTVDVTDSVEGTYTNTIPAGGITTAQGVSNTAAASGTLDVRQRSGLTQGVVTFYQYAPGAATTSFLADGGGYNGDIDDQPGGTNDQGGASFTPLPQATSLYGQPLDASQPLPVRETTVYHAGEPVIFTLNDPNRNADPTQREFVNVTLSNPVTGDTEILRLQETGPNTGVFATVIQSAGPDSPVVANDGRIAVDVDTTLRVDYTDPTDPLDVVQDNALVDPFGVLFDSVSGVPINGGTITIVNRDTGQPAMVFGDDGISSYPATLTFGGTATDGSGRSYDFPDGGYRYPFVPPGNYIYFITPPPGYVVPSSSCTLANVAACPLDPGGMPYSVVQGSFGDPFVVMPGPALNIDIPADPPADPLQDLLLQKTVSQAEASAGDFLQYRLSLQNRGAAIATTVTVTDTLPAGFRYQPGSLRVAGVAVADPAISADGATLTIAVGTLAAAPAAVEVRYLAQVLTGTAAREAINRAGADDDGVAGGRHSNTAQATVRIRPPLFSGAFTIVGRVQENCAIEPVPACPAAPPGSARHPSRKYTVRAQFDSGQATLKPEGEQELNRLVAKLKGKEIERIELIGHTDSQRLSAKTAARFGDNYGLSKARAATVGDYLARQLGLKPEQSGASGKGPDEPVAGNDTKAGMAKNRRTEVLVFERGELAAATSDCPAGPVAGGNGRGVANARVLLDDGTYVATDRDGLFHFEGVRPGTHVVQLDLDSLAPGVQVVPRIQNSRFAGRAYSQFVDVQGGGLWRTDFNVCPGGAQVGLKLATKRGLPARAADAVREFTVRANFDSGRDSLKAQGEADLNRLVAKLKGLDIERIEVIGHTDNQPLGAKTRARFTDNYGLSQARARAVGAWLARGLGLADEQVRALGRGPDEPLVPNTGAANMAKNRRTEVIVYRREKGAESIDAGALRHRVDVDGGGVPVKNLRVSVMLPEGVRYVPGSARLDGAKLADPAVESGLATFRLGDVGANWQRAIEFDTHLPAEAPVDACAQAGTARALATFDAEQGASLRTPTAENAIPCFEVGARPRTAADAAQVQSERGTVTVKGALVRETPAEIEQKTRKRRAIKTDVEAAGGDRDWLAGATPGVEWLYPEEGQSPRAPATRIVIKHRPGQSVTLGYVAGEAVHPLTFDGTKTNADNTVAVSVWRGVPLSDGENRFEAVVLERGKEPVRLVRVVHYANSPARVELVPEESVRVADGIHPPVIAVRILDREGEPVRDGVTGGFLINAPFVPRETIEQQQQRQLAGLDRFQPTWRIEGDDGVAYVELQPTTESGEAVLSFTFDTAGSDQARRVQEIRTWIEAAPRDWLVVGFAEGTVGYNTLKDNVAALPAGTEDEVYTDGQASLYAKGRVLGKWLLTLAYDSGKPDELERRRSLLSTIDPNEYYTLYGDGAEQRYDAPSQAKLYLKLERGQFYALFGDYNTGLTVTQLSRYNRTLNGVKSEFGGGPLVYSAFAAETAQNFARDEIRGDGTSGLYRLSRRGIVLNSEKIRIETRDRYRSEQVKGTRYLARHLDYDIDYANGTLFFREPVPSRDTDFNPVFVVAEYETFGAGDTELSAGGRLGVNLLGGRLSAGVSGIREEQFTGDSDLAGADVKLRVGEDTELRVEGARSDGRLGTLQREGDAVLAEVEHHGEKVDALLYSRRQEPGFGLNQQNASESGTDKLGADLGYTFTPNFAVRGQAYRQEYLLSDATREVGNAKLQYRDERNTLSAGYQVATDETAGGQQFESQQATFGASRNFFDRALELSAAGDVGLGGDNANLDFPSRYQFGASYALTPTARLIAAQEYTDGEAFDTSATRVGLQATPWKGARLNSTLNQTAIGEYGPRNFAQMGLTQALLLNERWGADLGVDSSRTFNESGQPAFVFNPNQPAAVTGGTLTDDFVAVSAGLTYRSELWSWNARAESRDGSSSERYGFTTGWLRQATAGIAVSASLQAFQTELAAGAEGRYGTANLSGAWRPLGSRWSVLDRLEFKYDELDAGTGSALTGGELFGNTTLNVTGSATSRRVVNNFNLNRVSQEWTEQDRQGNLFRLEQRNQWSLYYGAKYARDNYDGASYSGYTDLLGLEWRYDLTRRWDLGLQASSLNSWDNGTHQYSAGPQLGWSPVTNGWLSLGYNVVGFYDRDFEAARYTAQGPYLKLRFKFDQNTRIPGPDRHDPRAMEWDEYAAGPGRMTPPPASDQPASAAALASNAPPASGAPPPAVPLIEAETAESADNPGAAAPPAGAAGRYAISVQSFASAAEAEAYAARLRAGGHGTATVQAADVYGTRWYRVNIPGFDFVRDARPLVASLKAQFPDSDPWMLPMGAVFVGAAGASTAPARAPTGAARATPVRGRYVLVVASLPTAGEAEAYAARLRDAGYGSVEVSRDVVNGAEWHRVVIPGFGWAREAAGFGESLRMQFRDSDPWVMPDETAP